MNNNASDHSLTSPPPHKSSIKQPTISKTGKRPNSIEMETVEPGWVPKPPDDCPIVLWQEDGTTFEVQNPGNKGQISLKTEIYNSADMVYMCGLFLVKYSEMKVLNN